MRTDKELMTEAMDTMSACLGDLVGAKLYLETAHCGKTAKKMETVIGKLENLIYEVNDKVKAV